jgi:hypothetical protein
MSLGLRRGVSLDQVLTDLRRITMEGRNPLPMQFEFALNHYLVWVNSAESTLGNYFTDSGLEAPLRGVTHWHIRSNLGGDRRWAELLSQEMSAQAGRLEALMDEVKALQTRLDAVPGVFAVLDTHVLLHYQPPEQVRWSEVVGEKEIRLVVPLRVIEELDAKKYAGRADLADRARRLLTRLREMLAQTAGLPVRLADGVTIEVPVEHGPRSRHLDADYEILQTCVELQAVQRPVVLVTDDTGLAIRAANADVQWVAMPVHYLRAKSASGT